MDRAKVREVMDLTLCTEARARAALAAANGDQRAAVNEVLSPTTPSLHERTLQDALRRRGQTADEAFADRDLREAMQRSMGSGRSAAEEREMVERLRLHTDTTRVEARHPSAQRRLWTSRRPFWPRRDGRGPRRSRTTTTARRRSRRPRRRS